MSHRTLEVADRHLEVLGQLKAWTPGTYRNKRANLHRLAGISPELPVSPEDFKRYLTEDEPSLWVAVRRYDDGRQFFKGDVHQALGLPDVGEEVERPRATAPEVPDPKLPVDTAEIVKNYLEELRLNGRSESTLDTYRPVLADLVEEAPTLPPTVEQLRRVIGDPNDFKPSTRRTRYAVLSSLFHSEAYRVLGLENVLAQIPWPRKKAVRKRKFNDAELDALLAGADGMMTDFILLALDSGLRVGEIASITLEWIEDDQVSVDGKSGVREVPVSPSMVKRLRARANGNGEIWYDHRGRLDARQLGVAFRTLAVSVGLKGDLIGAHTLRRTFASLWDLGGGSMTILQRILDHSEMSTTQRYIAVVPDEVSQAHAVHSPARRMGLLGGDPTMPLVTISGIAEAAARREEAEEMRRAEVEYLRQVPCEERANGRRPTILPPEIAQMVLHDVNTGYSQSAIVRRFSSSPRYAFSRSWLAAVISDGRLEKMAAP